jgi:hypothetical protein
MDRGVRLSGNRDHCHNAASSLHETKIGKTGKDNDAPRIPNAKDTDLFVNRGPKDRKFNCFFFF